MFRWLKNFWNKITGREELLRKLEEKEKEVKELKQDKEKYKRVIEKYEEIIDKYDKLIKSYQQQIEQEKSEKLKMEEEYKKRLENLESEIKRLNEAIEKQKGKGVEREIRGGKPDIGKDKIKEIADFLISKSYFDYFVEDNKRQIINELIKNYGVDRRVAYMIVKKVEDYLKKIRHILDDAAKRNHIYSLDAIIESKNKKIKKILKAIKKDIKEIIFYVILKYGRRGYEK